MQVYRDTADRDGISLDIAPHGDKDFSLLGMPGSYRWVTHPRTYQAYDHTQQALVFTGSCVRTRAFFCLSSNMRGVVQSCS